MHQKDVHLGVFFAVHAAFSVVEFQYGHEIEKQSISFSPGLANQIIHGVMFLNYISLNLACVMAFCRALFGGCL